jgi:hypothetical protein
MPGTFVSKVPGLQEMFEAAVSGARTDEIEGVGVVIRPALTAAAVDVLEASAYLLGTPVRSVLDTRPLPVQTLPSPPSVPRLELPLVVQRPAVGHGVRVALRVVVSRPHRRSPGQRRRTPPARGDALTRLATS